MAAEAMSHQRDRRFKMNDLVPEQQFETDDHQDLVPLGVASEKTEGASAGNIFDSPFAAHPLWFQE